MVERHSDSTMHGLAAEEIDRRALRYHAASQEFQSKVFEKLIRHNAYNLDEGIGWAIFNDRQIDHNFVIAGVRKVLLLGLIDIDEDGESVVITRVVTNEKFNTKGRFSILSEDITVDGHGNAAYMASATLRYAAHVRPPFRPEDKGPAMSLGVVFSSSKNDLLIHQDFDGEATPVCQVPDPQNELPSTYPFGNCETLSDHQYALSKGAEILSHIQAVRPTESYQL